MDWEEFLGFMAGALTTMAYVPQLWRLFRLRSAHEISLPFTTLFIVGIASWLAYGIVLSLPPVIIWNAATLALGFAMLYAKLRFGR